MFDVFQTESLVSNQSEDASWRSDDDVGAVLLQGVLVLLYGHASEENRRFYCWHVLGETLVLFTNLEGQLSRVAHD